MGSPSSTGSSFESLGRGLCAALPLALLLTLVLALVAVTPALGAEHTVITGEYGKEGPTSTGTGNGCRLAWGGSSERIYLYSDEKIYALHRSGAGTVTPVGGAFPISVGANSGCGDPDFAVDDTSTASDGNLYVTPSNPAKIFGYSASGAALGSPWPVTVGFGENCGVAVGGNGDVFGGYYSGTSIERYSAAGTHLESIPFGAPICKLVIDPTTEDIFALAYSSNEIYKLTAASGYSTKTLLVNVGTNNAGLAVNGALNRIYVATGSGTTLTAYDTDTGAAVETVGVGAAPRDVTVDEATDTLYVQVGDGASGRILEYLGIKVPTATTGDPVGDNEVTGFADPNGVGPITDCYFEFGLASSSGFEHKADCLEAVPFNSAQSVHALLPELIGEETYKYRLVLDTGTPNVIGFGGSKSIVAHWIDEIETEAATNIDRTSADLNGSFVGNGEATSYFFEYGTSAHPYDTRVPASPTEISAGSPSGPAPTPMTAHATGLLPGTTYHFRVRAKNGQGSSVGADSTFTTSDAIKQLKTNPATAVTPNTAILNGELDPDGFETTYYFEYGKSTAYGHHFPLPPGNPVGTTAPGLTAVPGVELTNLEPSTTYHFRIVGQNSTGTTIASDDQAFTTPQAPSIVSFSSKETTATTAVLIAQINPRGEEATYYFEYGKTTSYGLVEPSPAGVLAPSSVAEAVEVPISGLEPSTYHFRLVAENKWGKSVTEDQTFNFYPPSCPNENVRQQTQANFLPDCRAFELVSPEDAAGTQFSPRGPNTGYATRPSRFSFTGMFNAVPNSGGKPIVGSGDLYVSTRTNAGWVTRYVGWPADEAATSGGPAMGPPGSQPRLIGGSIPSISSQMPGTGGAGARMQNGVITDLSMSRFLTFNGGNQSIGNAFNSDNQNRTPIASNAPRVYAADGSFLERWPQGPRERPGRQLPRRIRPPVPARGKPLPRRDAGARRPRRRTRPRLPHVHVRGTARIPLVEFLSRGRDGVR